MSADPFDYLAHERDLGEIQERYRNARRLLQDCPFVCHAGADFEKILELIAYPVLMDRFGDRYFLHNRSSGGSIHYKQLVKLALHACKVVLVVVSKNTIQHAWVAAEINWAIQHRRPIIMCRFDRTRAASVDPRLPSSGRPSSAEVFVADFRTNKQGARELVSALESVYRDGFPFSNLVV